MDGFKLSIELQMPTKRPNSAPLCDKCNMKHDLDEECWEGMLPAGMLPLPKFDKNMTGREMIDEDMPKSKSKRAKGKKRGS